MLQQAPNNVQVNPVAENELSQIERFLDGVLDTQLDPGLLLPNGLALWQGLATIVVVWTGLKIAYSGTFQAWEIVRLVFGLAIPLGMLQFYNQPIPLTANSFPETISAGGNWLADRFAGDAIEQFWQALRNLFTGVATRLRSTRFNLLAVGASFFQLVYTIFFLPLVALMYAVMFAIGYAQILWAKTAIALLTFLGPILIPWLVFQPMAFLFWGWFKAMWTFSLYAVLAGAMFRVWGDIAVDYLATLNGIIENGELGAITPLIWTTCALAICSILSMLRISQLASMLVTGSGAPGSGFLGVAGAAFGLGGAAARLGAASVGGGAARSALKAGG